MCVCVCICCCSIMSISLRPHGLQPARLPVLHYLPEFAHTHVPTHMVDAIQPYRSPSSPSPPSCLQSFPGGYFAVSQLFTSGGQSIGASASVFPVNIQGWFPLGLSGFVFWLSKGLSRVLQHHNLKASVLQHSAFFMDQLSHPYMTTGNKTKIQQLRKNRRVNIRARN